MKLATLITLRPTLRILSLARAELAKILCGLWSHVCKELHLNSPKGLSCTSLVVNPTGSLAQPTTIPTEPSCAKGEIMGWYLG
jgi:hypothetical protein